MDEQLNVSERTDGQDKTKHVLNYLIIITKWRRFIVVNVLIVTVVAVIVSLLIRNWYASTASVLPPKQPSGGLLGSLSGVSSVVKDLKNLSRLGGGSAMPEGTYNYLAILGSRTALEKVIRKFNLMEVYGISDSSMEKTIKVLQDNVEVNVEKEGNVTITVADGDPKRAADMANYFVEVLNDVSINLGTREARNNREFIERRYLQNQEDLKHAEDSLKVFQQKYGIYSLPVQTESAIKAAAALKSEVVAKEIQLGVAEKALGQDNPQVQTLRLGLQELNKKVSEMKFGTEDWYQDKSLNLFVPFKDVPQLGMEYVRLYRNFEIQNRLIEFLLPLYEQAKYDEQKETPVVLVLDPAVPPERKSGPKRLLIVLAAGFSSLILALLYVTVKEQTKRLKEHHPEEFTQLRSLFFRKRQPIS
jgi:capsule polysaccharide export protein KpsE/RkpR